MSEIKDGDVPITMQQRINLLHKVCAVLNAHDINYFLTCGTLLGYMRENDFIKWDADIDMGIFDAHEVFKLEKQFEKLGLRCRSHYYPNHYSLRFSIRDNELDVHSKLHVDLYEFEDIKDGIVFKFSYKQWYIELIRNVLKSVFRIVQKQKYPASYGVIELLEASSIPSVWKQRIRRLHEWNKRYLYKQGIHIFRPFTSVEVLWFGIFVKIPSRPISHLRLLYGDEWHIPNPNYSQSKERQRNIRRIEL